MNRQHETLAFLWECRLLLKPGGLLRLVVPDPELMVHEYVRTGSADLFIELLNKVHRGRSALIPRLILKLSGEHTLHRWDSDKQSLISLVAEQSFPAVYAVQQGQTRIPDPGLLKLHERHWEPLYVEAFRE